MTCPEYDNLDLQKDSTFYEKLLSANLRLLEDIKMSNKKISEKQAQNALKVLKQYEAQEKVARKNANSGLNYWTKRGFEVVKTGFKVACGKDKKQYDAVILAKDGVQYTKVATRGGNVYAKPW